MPPNPNRNLRAEASLQQPEQLDMSDPLVRSLRHAHEKFGIPLNVAEVVERTITHNGFISVPSESTPSVEAWIAERLTTQGYAGYNHGSFVQDAVGTLGFAKVHYGPDNLVTTHDEHGQPIQTKVGGPKREAEVLQALLPNGYEAPQVLSYSPESPIGASSANADTFEMLVIEAVLPEDGAVRKREDWTPALAQQSAQKIATFAKPIEAVPLFADESIPLPVEKLVEKIPHTGDTYDQSVAATLQSYSQLDEPIVVHGDTWFNNIIARHDDSDITFIDWELAGPGYQGQDAGRKLWDLTLDSNWGLANYGDNAQAFTNEWCKDDETRQSLAFGVVYESLRWISDRSDKLADPTTDEATRISLTQEIDDVKAHTLMVLEHLTPEQ